MSAKHKKSSDAPIFIVGGLIVIVAVVVAIILLTGDKGYFVNVVNPNGVSKGSPVIWQNACVGSVKKLREENGNYTIGFMLASEFKKKIHEDVKACPVKQSNTKVAVLLLVGGKDESRPLLADGSKVTGITESELPMAQLKDKYTDLKNFKGWNEIVGWIVLVIIICIGYKFIRRKGKKGFPFLSGPNVIKSGKTDKFSTGYGVGYDSCPKKGGCCCRGCAGDLMGDNS